MTNKSEIRGVVFKNLVWAGLILALTLFAVSYYATIAATDPNPRITVLREDSFQEYAQAVMLGIGAIAMLLAGIRSQVLRKGRGIGRYFWTLFWVLLLVVFTGEEVSWGQRIIGWETPDWEIFEGNTQEESNLHNHPMLNEVKGNMVKYFMLFFGIMLPLATMTKTFRLTIQSLGFPVIQLHYVPVFAAAYLLYSYQIYPQGQYGVGPVEYSETFFAFGLMMFGLHGIRVPDSIFGVYAPSRR